MDGLKGNLIACIEANDWQKFAEVVNSAGDRPDVAEVVKAFEKKELEDAWEKINKKSTEILLTVFEEFELTERFKLLKSISLFALQSADVKFDSQSFFDAISLLSSAILTSSDEDDVLRNLLSLVCETLWKESSPGSDELVTYALHYLFDLHLRPRPKAAATSRLHSIRAGLSTVDLHSDDGKIIWDLLFRVIASGNLFKSDKGRKFVTFAFCLDARTAADVHQILKPLIATVAKSNLPWIAQVYFSAWKSAEERGLPELLQCIETDCVQDLMFTALHSPRDSALDSQFVRFFKVLSHFHKEKKSMRVSSMLHRLYSPILFRSLKVSNGIVRANAAFLLSDVFPLCDLDRGREFNERSLLQQLNELDVLMEDSNLKVRQAVVAGVFSILGSYWELLPTEKIKSFVAKMLRSMAWDVSSYEVRLCVARGFASLVDNCLAFPTLKKVLPKLTNMFHDINEKVRLTFVDLLFKVKSLRDLKFWQVVPMDHLLARLEEDNPPMVRKLVVLLTDTFAPPTASLSSQLYRCIKMFSANVGAARRFYLHLASSLDVVHGCKFVVYILEKLTSQINNGEEPDMSSQSHERMEDDDLEVLKTSSHLREDSQETGTSLPSIGISLDDTSVVTYLCETAFLLLAGMKKALSKPEHASTSRLTLVRITKLTPRLVRAYQHQASIANPLLLMCSRFSAKLFPTISSSIVSKLSSVPDLSLEFFHGDVRRSTSIRADAATTEDGDSAIDRVEILLDVACRWKKGSEILDAIGEWVVPMFGSDAPKRSSRRAVKFRGSEERKPMLAAWYLGCLLQNRSTRVALLSDHSQKLGQLNVGLKNVLDAIRDRLTAAVTPPPTRMSEDLLVGILRLHLVIDVLLHLSNANKDDMKLEGSVREVLEWARSLIASAEEGKSRPSRKRKRNRMSDDVEESSSVFEETSMTWRRENSTVMMRNVMMTLARLVHDLVALDLLGSETLMMVAGVCTAMLETDATVHIISNVIDVADVMLDDHKESAVVIATSIFNSLALLAHADDVHVKEQWTQKISFKIRTLFCRILRNCDRSDIASLVRLFISCAVERVVDDVEKGRLPPIVNRGDGDNIFLPHEWPRMVDLALDVMGHKRAGSSAFLDEFCRLCGDLDASDPPERTIGFSAFALHLLEKLEIDRSILERCCRVVLSKMPQNYISDARCQDTTSWLENARECLIKSLDQPEEP